MSRTADPRAKIALLRSAEVVFAEKGLTSARIEEITKRAGLSKGAFYLHFESKEVAFRQVVESFLARCRACMLTPEETENLPGTTAEVIAFCHARDLETYEFLWQNRAIVAILQSCGGDHTYLMQAFVDEMSNNCRVWVELWQKKGLFRADVNADIASALLTGAYNQLAGRMVSMASKPPIEEWLRQAQAIFFHGLGTPALAQAFQRAEEKRPNRAGTKLKSAVSKVALSKSAQKLHAVKGAG
ncbi:MAG: TetR/AcrR family transcriptional regulator [Polyangiaceae bacterium]